MRGRMQRGGFLKADGVSRATYVQHVKVTGRPVHAQSSRGFRGSIRHKGTHPLPPLASVGDSRIIGVLHRKLSII